MAKEMSERGRSIIDVYLENAIPLAAVAPMCRKNVIEMADHLVIIGEDLRTCLGDHDERNSAQQAVIEGKDQGAVLDTIAVWRASQLGVLDDLRDWFGTLYVAQSTFDELLELRSSSEFASRRDTGFLGYHEAQALSERAFRRRGWRAESTDRCGAGGHPALLRDCPRRRFLNDRRG